MRKEARVAAVEDKSLEQMESFLTHSARGVHVLFDNQAIADVLKEVADEKDFLSIEKMKKVQDSMTELVAKKTYIDKLSYLKSLDQESFRLLVRAYFHIVENTIRASQEFKH